MFDTEPLTSREPVSMPNKTIYVSESDLPVFERAQELAGGNLSATITQALRKLVEREEQAQRGFTEVEVTVGTIVHVPKRFVGRALAKGKVGGRIHPLLTTYEVYQTQKGRFALHVQSEPNWQSDDIDWSEPNEYRLDDFDTLEEIKDLVPRELYDASVAATSDEGVEYLDI